MVLPDKSPSAEGLMVVCTMTLSSAPRGPDRAPCREGLVVGKEKVHEPCGSIRSTGSRAQVVARWSVHLRCRPPGSEGGGTVASLGPSPRRRWQPAGDRGNLPHLGGPPGVPARRPGPGTPPSTRCCWNVREHLGQRPTWALGDWDAPGTHTISRQRVLQTCSTDRKWRAGEIRWSCCFVPGQMLRTSHGETRLCLY